MNNLIIATRGKGKTAKLIERCHNDKYSLIVCPTKAMCENTFRQAIRLNMQIPMPITFQEFINNEWYGMNIDNFYFDELQMSLQTIAGGVNISDVVIDVSHSVVRKLV